MNLRAAFASSLITVALTAAASAQLEVADIFIELNDTDEDVGIHFFFDGDGYDRLRVRDVDRQPIMTIKGTGTVGFQGLTETKFESSEPNFEVQSLAEFLALFPAGDLNVEARNAKTGAWVRLRDVAFTHTLPGAPILVSPIDGEETEVDDTVLRWMPLPIRRAVRSPAT